MKYYATQIGTDPEGAPTILQQVEVGAPLANYWEMRNVCDTDGNTYYSYGSIIGKITSTGVETTINVDNIVPQAYAASKCVGVALDRDENPVFMFFLSGGTYYTQFYKISKTDFSTNGKTLLAPINSSVGKDSTFMCIDKLNNIWFGADQLAVTYTNIWVLNPDRNTIYTKSNVANFATRPCLDSRGFCWGLPQNKSSSKYLKKFTYDGITTISEENTANIDDGLSNYLNCIDGVCWTNGTIHYLYILNNLVSDIVNPCHIKKIDITNHNAISTVSTLTLTGLVDCYNLHTNTAGDIFFSTYGTVDGYNTYKIAHDDFTFDKVTNLYISGLGSKTTGNDPYGYFLSQYGHTGANI